MSATSPDGTLEARLTRQINEHAKQIGYLFAAAANAVALWIAHQLLDWGWPDFLTAEFDDLLPLVTIALVIGIVTNLFYVGNDRWPYKPIGELLGGIVGVVLAVRTLQIFPFDFAGYDRDWSTLARVIAWAILIVSAIGVLAHAAKLVSGPPTPDGPDDEGEGVSRG